MSFRPDYPFRIRVAWDNIHSDCPSAIDCLQNIYTQTLAKIDNLCCKSLPLSVYNTISVSIALTRKQSSSGRRTSGIRTPKWNKKYVTRTNYRYTRPNKSVLCDKNTGLWVFEVLDRLSECIPIRGAGSLNYTFRHVLYECFLEHNLQVRSKIIRQL
jgi:hypothetical protein